jgi:hypothetical protein
MKRMGQPMMDVWGNGAVLNSCLKQIERPRATTAPFA